MNIPKIQEEVFFIIYYFLFHIFFFYLSFAFLKQKKLTVLILITSEDGKESIPYEIPNMIGVIKSGELNFSQLIQNIKDIGFDLDNHLISYWSPTSEMNVFCGKDPLAPRITISKEDYYESEYVLQANKNNLINMVCNEIQESYSPFLRFESKF